MLDLGCPLAIYPIQTGLRLGTHLQAKLEDALV